jgi:hypothetical protein
MLMKKALLIALALGLIAAWACPAMAVDLSVNGMIGVAGQISKNDETSSPYPQDTVNAILNNQMATYISSRARLIFTLRASEDLYGVFGFKMDYHQAGAYVPATGAGPGSWYAVVGGQVRGIEIQNVFIDFRVPPKLPVWFRVGMQNVFERGWVFLCADMPGVSMRVSVDPIKLALTGYFMKVLDQNDLGYSAQYSGELYGVDAALPVDVGPIHVRPGMYFFYQDLDTAGMNFVGPPPFRFFFPEVGIKDTHLYWIGGFMDGKIGPVNTQVDFIYNGGRFDGMDGYYPSHESVNSWLVRGQASYVFKKLEVGAGGMYVRGENSSNESIQSFMLPGGFYGSECWPVLGDWLVLTDGWMGTSAFPGPTMVDYPRMFSPGVWYVRGFAYYNVFDWMKLGVNFGYIGDTVGGDGSYYTRDAIGTDNDNDNTIGWELDVGLGLKIYKNLSLNTGFGYLFAGKALALNAGDTVHGLAGVAAPEGKPNDPWVVKSMLMYTF